ncbi:MAG: glycyl-radical enzyme activating protein [Oscillospiraceae bacterium]|nr:glycyl-radical enzyme activating protein [Oscillospiraceae bacterium]
MNITNIQGYSIHDGPGIRTVVFSKGCPMRCAWCANPENLSPKQQVGFIAKLCQNCGRCAKACPQGAILPSEYRIDREKCISCGTCTEACFYGALVKYGDLMSAEEVFKKVRRDKMFYETSGGGVTVSGGEPMTQADFVTELFRLCKEDGIHTCIETCGYASSEGYRKVIPYTDLFYFDLKIMEPELHKKYTGCDNALIHQNAKIVAESGVSVLFRQPVIPTVNDTEDNIVRTAEFILSLGKTDLQLMPYHRAGQTKYDALQMTYQTAELPIMPAERINEIKDRYISLGINCTISK